ncbi:hypothetical protein WN943_008732 [Citrus x changshan-huyou]
MNGSITPSFDIPAASRQINLHQPYHCSYRSHLRPCFHAYSKILHRKTCWNNDASENWNQYALWGVFEAFAMVRLQELYTIRFQLN